MDNAPPLTPLEEEFINKKPKEEFEYELTSEEKKYKLIISLKQSDLLLFKLKEIDIITSTYYESENSLKDLIKIDKLFRSYDTGSEVIEILSDIINMNQVLIKNTNDDLEIIFKFPLPGNKIKEIPIPFNKKNFELKNMNAELVKTINDLEKNLKKEIEKNNKYKIIIEENSNIIKENNKTINELKEEIKLLKDNINELNNWKKEINKERENLKKLKKIKDSKIIEEIEDFELIDNRLKFGENDFGVTYKLLYKASIDGDRAKTFHLKCNGIKGTLCLVKTKDNFRFGGYTEAKWDGRGFKEDTNAFCFSLNSKIIYNLSNPEKSIKADEKSGPRFGDTLFAIKDEAFKYGGWCNCSLDSEWESTDKDYELTGGKDKFGVEEIEVFQIIIK